MSEEFGESFATDEGKDVSPPTPRPDVEGIRAWFRDAEEGTSVDTNKVISLCDYALELEKERDELKAADYDALTGKADSLLADLVEKGEEFKDGISELRYSSAPTFDRQDWDSLHCCLTAAKQHLESGEEGKNNDR